MRASLFFAALCVACGGAPTRSDGHGGSDAVVTARGPLSDAELDDLRSVVASLVPGTDRATVDAAIGGRLAGLGAIGTGPTTGVTEIYVLGGDNVLWMTWDASDASAPILLRAVVWNQATDPMPGPLPPPAP